MVVTQRLQDGFGLAGQLPFSTMNMCNFKRLQTLPSNLKVIVLNFKGIVIENVACFECYCIITYVKVL